MIYKSNISRMPVINFFYTVRRNTVWHITDKHNILIFIKEGRCRFTAVGESVIVEQGQAYFIPEGVPYLREPIDNEMCTMTYIHFSVDDPFISYSTSDFSKYVSANINAINDQLFANDNANSSHSTNSQFLYDIFISSKTTLSVFNDILTLLNSINLFSSERPATCLLQSSLALGNILLNLYKELTDSVMLKNTIDDIPAVSPKIKKALNYISQNYYLPINLENIASHCTVSKQQLIRYFKTYLNTTPTQYILNFKIAKAKELLFNHHTLNIKEIANGLGFEDQHYFSRIFKKQTGESPSEYRYRVHNYSDKNNK